MGKHSFISGLLVFGCLLQPAPAQSIVQLPANLADPSTSVKTFFNKDPRSGQNNRALGQICEGPAVDSAGNLFFAEWGNGPQSIIWKVTPEGLGTAFLAPANGSLGLEFDSQWRMVVAQNNQLVRFKPNGLADTLVKGASLGNLNEVSIATSGHIIVSNLSQLFLIGPKGGLIDSASVAGMPNGVEIIEEKGLVYVTLSSTNKICKFNWSPSNPGNFRSAVAGLTDFVGKTSAFPDGITTDSLGNVYSVSNTTGSIIVYSPAGDSIGFITVRGRAQSNASNCAFGGPGNRTLYITGAQGAYMVQMKVPGRLRPSVSVSIRQTGNGARGGKILLREGFEARTGFVSIAGEIVEWRGASKNGGTLVPGVYVLKVSRGNALLSAQSLQLRGE